MSSAVISARGLSKVYNAKTVVDGISFDIPAGACYGLLGPNGAGKTTTLRIILGLTPLSSGTLSVFGQDAQQHARMLRHKIGVVSQQDNLDPDFSVEENLLVYGSFFRIPKQVLKSRVVELLALMQLQDRAKHKPSELSGGMKRRLAIARALINDPELVILDEPTTGLDPQVRHVIWDILRNLKNAGKTLLLTTHYMDEAERLCDQLLLMDGGTIIEQGSPIEIIRKHVEKEVIEIHHPPANLEFPADCRVERHADMLYCYSNDATQLLASLPTADLRVLLRPCSLEDVFLRLTGRELRE